MACAVALGGGWPSARAPREMAEISLAHAVGSDVERAYQRSDMLEKRRAMMADWGRFLTGDEAGTSNVVQLGVQA